MAKAVYDTAALLHLAVAGDAQALGALFERYHPGLYAIALRMLGYSEDARDAVQDSFLHALTKFDSLRDPQAFLGWLQSIVERNCLVILRRRRNGPLETMPHALLHERFADLPEEDRIPSGLNYRLVSAFHDLPPVLQETAALRYFSEQNSYEEIAATLAIPVGTVRSRLAEARMKLKNRLVADDIPDDLKKSDTAYAWEEFYWETWNQFYEKPAALDKYYRHLEPDLRIIFTSGKQLSGRRRMLDDFREDMQVGINVVNQSIISTGKITIIDSVFTNPPEHPEHCPPAGATVHYHCGQMTWQVRYHHAPRMCAGPFGSEEERCKAC